MNFLPSSKSYYNEYNVLEFHSDHTYRFYQKTSKRFVSEFNRGTWGQKGKKLILYNKVIDPKELPILLKSFPNSEPQTELVINILPKKEIDLDNELEVTDIVRIDLVTPNAIFPVSNATVVIKLTDSLKNAYLRMYKIPSEVSTFSMHNDTLYSRIIDLTQLKGRLTTINADCNPLYFAQKKMLTDTILLINSRKIRWPSKNVTFELH